ncbi:MAG: 16S rRNA (cytosine(1402)-N(4))-methyltransferase RsmH [Chloroflexota bacterium]
MQQVPHLPVLYHEILEVLKPSNGKSYVDGTLGAGGHAWGILEASAPDGKLLGIDVDPQALGTAKQRLAEYGERVSIAESSYTMLSAQLKTLNWKSVDGIVLDFGASSMQFDTASRGFSFMHDGPLDMRFSPTGPLTAGDIVNTWEEKHLANMIFKYGEERRSRQIARAIMEARPLESTQQLAEVISKSIKGHRKSRIHPATRTFQALRISVNGELEAIEDVLPQAITALGISGRLAVITFHSLEDRIVKHFFRKHSRDQYDEQHPMRPVIQTATLKLVNRKPISASVEEVYRNPRARSAKLRAVEKI